jgi:hypothetical protein
VANGSITELASIKEIGMFDYIGRMIDEYGHGLTYLNLYGLKVEPNPNNAKRVQEVIDKMGDKYLLAKPVERINGRP